MNKLALLAFNKKFGGGSDPAVLEELTVTKNGVYVPSGNVEFGKTYTFKEDLEDVDLEALFNQVSDNGYRADFIFTNYVYDEVYIECEGFYSLFVNLPGKGYYAYFNAYTASCLGRKPGWYKDEGGWVSTSAPTITIVDKDTPNVTVVEDLSIMAPFFDIQAPDGYNKVVVDVVGSDLEEITITKNGIYEPAASVELGGTYKFRDDYTDEELETLKNNNCFIESMGGDIWISESQTDSGERYNRLAFYIYATGQSYSYYTAKAAKIDLNTETAGWYSSNQLVEAPTITIPASSDQVWGDLSAIAPLFVYPDGYNKINVNVEPELDEITVTKNGVYEASKGIELGGTYTFRDNYTDDEFRSLYPNGVVGFAPFVSTNEFSIGLQEMGNNLYYLLYASSQDMSFGFAYITEGVVSSGMIPVNEAGWVNMLTMEKVDAPSVTLSAQESEIFVSLSVFESVFDLLICDGWNKITVDVAGSKLDEITITENGVYEPVKGIEFGGTYTFKEDLEDLDFAEMFNKSIVDGEFGDFIYASNGFTDNITILKAQNGDSTYYYLEVTVSKGNQYHYLNAEAASYRNSGKIGWYYAHNYTPATAPTVTIPESTPDGGWMVKDISVLMPFFGIVPCDGYNKITVNVTSAAQPVLGELVATENGEYTSSGNIDLGKTYTFKSEYTDEELKEFYDSQRFCEVIGTDIWTDESYTNSGEYYYILNYYDYVSESYYQYLTKKAIMLDTDLGAEAESGWYVSREGLVKLDPPTVTFPSNPDEIFSDLSVIAPLFMVPDGWNKVVVDIPLGELKVTNNGIYEPVKAIELGGTYTFKNSYTDEELAALSALGRLQGSHSYFIDNSDYENYFTIATQQNGGKVAYGIYTYYAVYVGEEASKLYSNGVPGWYAYSASDPCDAPTITIPTDESLIYVNLAAFEPVFPISAGYNKIVVDVQGTAAPVLEELEVTENGEYTPNEADGYSKVVVAVERGVFPEGELEITKIGTYDVTQYATIDVNISSILPVDVMTEAEMNELLTSGQHGGVYRYMGTTGTYERGELYLLEEVGD